MASYKVAQDVEAEDKLLGPFSFRQFIYLVIAAMAGVLAYGLSRVFVGLIIIPAPIIIFFLALALPLRKDQPMEVYLAAIVSFYLKPRKRLWQPDGVQSLVEITASPSEEQQLTKNISGSEAERRLAYLATLADTQGWSIRNATTPQANASMIEDAYHDAQSVPDSFDENSGLARSIDSMIDRADSARRQALIDQMHNPQPAAPAPVATTPADFVTPQTATAPQASTDSPQLSFNPYPTSMRQHIISPSGQTPAPDPQVANTPQVSPQPMAQSTVPLTPPTPPAEPEQTTSGNQLSPDIINLANNKDLSVETIAREAHRIEAKRHEDDEEVVISLR